MIKSIVTFYNGKGGVGKTTSALSFSDGLRRAGKRVLTIDLDWQGQVARSLGVEFQRDVAGPLMLPDEIDLASRIVSSGRDGWDLIPASRKLSEARVVLEARQDSTVVKRLVAELPVDYDVVVIDCSPAYDILSRNAYMAATDLVIPVKADFMSTLGLNDAWWSLEEARAGNARLRRVAILPTCVQDGELADEIMRLLKVSFKQYVVDAIPTCKYVQKAFWYHKTIFELRPSARSAVAYAQLANRWL